MELSKSAEEPKAGTGSGENGATHMALDGVPAVFGHTRSSEEAMGAHAVT